MSTEEKKSVVSPLIRLWFKPYLLTPRAAKKPGDDPKYSITGLVTPGTMDAQEKTLWLAMVKDANESAMAKHKMLVRDFTDSMKKPWHNGREKTKYGMTDQDLYFTMSSKFQPGFAGLDGKKVAAPLPTMFYAGCYVRVSTAAYSYSVDGGKGTNFGLFNIMFAGDGEPLKFAADPEEDFSEYATTATGTSKVTDDDLGL